MTETTPTETTQPDPWRKEYLAICHRTADVMRDQCDPYILWMHRGIAGRSGWAICLSPENTPAGFDTDRMSGMGKTWWRVDPPAGFKTWDSVPMSDHFFALFWELRDKPVLGAWTPENPSPYDTSK